MAPRNNMSISLPERCACIELLVLDVDGVLTDGSIVYTDAGAEIKAFHVRDGSGLMCPGAAVCVTAAFSSPERSSARANAQATQTSASVPSEGSGAPQEEQVLRGGFSGSMCARA